jgi:hypothetical protein
MTSLPPVVATVGRTTRRISRSTGWPSVEKKNTNSPSTTTRARNPRTLAARHGQAPTVMPVVSRNVSRVGSPTTRAWSAGTDAKGATT